MQYIKKCLICNKDFFIYESRKNKAKFCSYKCFYKWSKGKSLNTGRTHFKKGYIPWNAGKSLFKKCLICNKEFKTWGKRKETGKYCSRKCQSVGYHNLYKNKHGANWKGGKKIHQGYVMIFKPEHPNSISHGYVFEHRLVMEKKLSRYLNKNKVVHHKNGNLKDNRIENLQLFTDNGKHIKEELLKKGNWLKELGFGFKKGHIPWNKERKII